MIKIREKRYNLDAIREYYPLNRSITQIDSQLRKEHCIILVWRTYEDRDTVVKFESENERDETLEAMDQVSLLIKDGKVVERIMDIPPFMIGGGEFGGPGGVSVQ